MSDRIRLIPNSVNGKDVLLIDLSQFAIPTDGLPYIREARDFVGMQRPLSVYCLVDVTAARFNVEVVEALKDLATHNRPFVVATALIGVSGLQRVIFESIVAFSGRKNLKPFPSRDEAFAWLATQTPAI